MDNLTTAHTDTPSGSRIGDYQTKRTRSRTPAQRTASHYRQSYQVEEFNRREMEREKLWLVERIGAVHSFTGEAPIISLMAVIQGYLNWYLISGHPVELSRHTCIGRTMTAVVMAHIGG